MSTISLLNEMYEDSEKVFVLADTLKCQTNLNHPESKIGLDDISVGDVVRGVYYGSFYDGHMFDAIVIRTSKNFVFTDSTDPMLKKFHKSHNDIYSIGPHIINWFRNGINKTTLHPRFTDEVWC